MLCPPPLRFPCCSVAATTPSTAEWMVGQASTLQQCVMLQRWAVVMLNVVLPLGLLRLLEVRAQLRFQLHEEEEALAAALAVRGGAAAAGILWADGEDEARRAAARVAACRAKLEAEVAKSPLTWTLELYLVSTVAWATICFSHMR